MMLKAIHSNRILQLALGLLIGVAFGFLLHKGRVIYYDVIIGQLLLKDFTVVKVMLTAVAVGMLGVYSLKSAGLAQLHVKTGSIGSTVIGGLIFGVGFAILGYCPGTVLAAAGRGALDALAGGIVGTLIGVWLFAVIFPKLDNVILNIGAFGKATIPELLGVHPWVVVLPVCCAILAFLIAIEKAGL
jgi:hypothetical protein